MIPDEKERAELFALVWERPMVDVAKELGISDVALKKRCKNLQVPTPPRGYWAKIRSGQKIKQPPLKAFVEELWEARREVPAGQIQLSEMQSEFLHRALEVLQRRGADVSACDSTKNLVRKIAPELAADVIVCVQREFLSWIPAEELSERKAQGALQSVGKLVAKLLPLAKRQILLLKKTEESRYSSSDVSVSVRVTPDFLADVSRLLSIVREHKLEYVAKSIPGSAHAWSARYAYSLGDPREVVSQLCVSESEFWFYGVSAPESRTDELTTDRIRISEVVPVELLDPNCYEMPERVSWSVVRSYEDRVRAIEFADSLHSALSDSLYSLEESLPDETLRLVEKLWFNPDNSGVFAAQKRRIEDLGDTLESWEELLELEKEKLVVDVLGVGPGDDVAFLRDGSLVKMRARYINASIQEDELSFSITGMRYNKDGLLGKRDEWFHISVPRR